MRIDERRLRKDIESNAAFGTIEANEGHGRTVLTGSDADRRAREYLIERMEDADMDVRIDPVGNIAGRWIPDGIDPDVPPIAAGSHLDSVPFGGIFDGPLGVYGALEAVRAIQESSADVDRPLEVVSFTEEEGTRFGIGLLGSSVAAGNRDVETALGLEDEGGTTLRNHLATIGFDGDDRIDAKTWDAWLELHIEQGRILESAGNSVGVVEAISGISNCLVEISGEANHAGATPMFERTDSLTAASEFILAVEQGARNVAATKSATAVGTVGKLDVRPNAKNAVAGDIEIVIDVRDIEYEAMNAIIEHARTVLNALERTRGVSTEFDRYRDQRPSRMSNRCVDAAIGAAEADDIKWQRMHSAALHDTAQVADVTDTVLLFAPSKKGISHNPREWTDWDNCATAAHTLAGTITTLSDK